MLGAFIDAKKNGFGAVCIPVDVERVGSPWAELEGVGRRWRLADDLEV